MQYINRATSTVVNPNIDSTMGGIDMKYRNRAAVVAVMAMIFAALAGTVSTAHAASTNASAPATASHVLDACLPPFTVGFVCTFQNANTSSSSTSHVHIVTNASFTANVRVFEQLKGAVVGFNMMPNGLPASMQKKCKWGDFDWSGWKTVNGKTVYTRTPNHGRTHACWDGHNWRQIGGGPGQWNCGNIVMEHRPHGTIVPRVIAFRSHGAFTSTFDQIVTKSSTQTSNAWCNPGGLLVLGGTKCMFVTPVPVTPTPTPGPPTVNCPAGTVKDSAGNCVVVNVSCPTGTIKDSNGNCVVQTNTAAQNCQQAATAYPGATVSFNNDTLTCTIVQVNGNCSNIVVIIGGGSPVIHQEGNCNTAPPPPAITIGNLTAIQEVYVNEVRSNVCVDVNTQGAAGTVVFSAVHGSFTTGRTQTVQGVVTGVCATYVAPSDPMTDSITVTLNVTGQNSVSVPGSVTVLPLPPPPLSDVLSSNEANNTL